MKLPWRPELRASDLWGDTLHRPTILFNGLSLAFGGALTVMRSYWRSFQAQRPDWRFVILHSPFEADLAQGLGPGFRLLDCGARTHGLVGRYLWERKWLGTTARRLECDIYFGPTGVYRSGVAAPQCLLIQDPTPFLLKSRGVRGHLRTWLLRRAWRAGVQNAACLGYTSRYMRSLVLADSGGRTERRHLIAYNGVDPALVERCGRPPTPRDRRQPDVLSVSTLCEHKNFETLIRALALLRRQEAFRAYRLRILGRDLGVPGYVPFLRNEIRRLRLEAAVTIEANPSWGEICAAYEAAALFSLTSLCESFGIPALEAMAFGTPVVAGDCCAIPEVCADAARLVPPRSAEAVAQAWSEILTDGDAYTRMQAAGQRRCQAFSWDQTVAQWLEVMQELLTNAPRADR